MLFLDFSVTLVMELENLSINQTLSVIFNNVLYEQLHKGMQYLESSMLIGTLIALSIFNQQGNLVFLRSAGFSPLKIVLVSGLGPIILSLVLIFFDETLFLDLSKKSNTLNQPIQSAEIIQWEMADKNLIGLRRLNDKQVQAIQIIEFNDQQRVASNCSYEEALSYVEDIQEDIDQKKNYAEPKYKNITGAHKFQSNFSKDSYMQSVKTIKNYIKDGDVMQVVLAQDFSSAFDSDPFHLYSALRKLNPSPYMYYLNLNDCKVIGASPEILVRLEENDVTLRPIAGTRKRGIDKIEDEENVKELLSDPKELAEHLMLIDLGRNDVGKVSEIGSVKVTEKMVIEKYSHVMHIVSNVVGKLLKGLSAIDALKGTLPAGTLSGAPKIRAMEIINELEPSSRGIYGGAIGHISWNGNIDTAIAIRTAVIKDGLIHVGAGAGIVADSDPESEWRECVQKSKVFADAMEMIS